MKRNRKSFGLKLWSYFALFAAVIFVTLWLLQTVFLQNFYNEMAIRNAKSVAAQITKRLKTEPLEQLIDAFAYEESLLILLTDRQGTVLYSADEHSSLYWENRSWHVPGSDETNPYRDPQQPLSWQAAESRRLPQGYDELLKSLPDHPDGLGYTLKDGSAYVYGIALPASGSSSNLTAAKETVLCVSMPLGAVGATVGILRVQLIWVTLTSLVIGFIIAFFLSRRFAQPISVVSSQARRMADGDFDVSFEKGFCMELDNLSDTLEQTAASLRKLEHSRRELLANVSHDLRTPLTMIKGYAEILREISWEDAKTREEDLSVIIREADRLTELVNDILEYSSLQSSVQNIESQPVNLSSAAEYVIDQLAPLCREKGIVIEASLQPGQWVAGSSKQLMRVLYNLIDNAITHSVDGKKIQVTLSDLGESVRTEVRDHGSGIPKDQLPYIWDRYFTSKQRNKKSGGTGLGLAITKEILSAQGADFGVESELGQGSLFWFELRKLPLE